MNYWLKFSLINVWQVPRMSPPSSVSCNVTSELRCQVELRNPFGVAKIPLFRRYLNDNWHQITDFCIEVMALFATHAIYSNVWGILKWHYDEENFLSGAWKINLCLDHRQVIGWLSKRFFYANDESEVWPVTWSELGRPPWPRNSAKPAVIPIQTP